MVVPLGGGGKGRGGVPDDVVVYSATTEHGRTLHRYVITAVPMLWVGEVTSRAGGYEMVGESGHLHGGGKGSGGGNGGGGKVRGERVMEGT